MSSERRLHPLTIILDVLERLPSMIVPFVLLFFAARGGSLAFLWPFVIASAVIILTSVVRYFRYTYHYDGADLVIRSGLFVRNERRIPFQRIQNLDSVQTLLHRVFGVTVVLVQTGAGVEPEATLRVVPIAELTRMRTHILEGREEPSREPAESETRSGEETRDAGDVAQETSRTLLALTPRELMLAGFIENRGMVVVIGALALLEQTGFFERMPERFASDTATSLGQGLPAFSELSVATTVLYATLAVILVLVFIRVLSTVWALVRLHDFRLTRNGDELLTEYGMFTRVRATIPLHRIQSITITDSLLHRMLDRRAVTVETAGGVRNAAGGTREAIAPILHVGQLRALLHELQPSFDLDDVAWQPIHPRAFGRMLRGSLLFPIVATAVAAVLVDFWAIGVFVVLFARAVFKARLRARNHTWACTADSIVVRDGALTRGTRIARFNRIQVVAMRRNPFDRRTGMATVRAVTAGARSGIRVQFLPERTADLLRADLVASTEATAFTW